MFSAKVSKTLTDVVPRQIIGFRDLLKLFNLRREFEEIEKAQIEVRELFTFSKVGTIAGCYVLSGKVDRNVKVRVMRNEEMIFEGDIDSLKRFKDDVKEVSEKFECGIVLKGFDTLQKGDLLYCYTVEQKKVI